MKHSGWQRRSRLVLGSRFAWSGALLTLAAACSLDNPQLRRPDGGDASGGESGSGGGGAAASGGSVASGGTAPGGSTASGGRANGGGVLPTSGGTASDPDASTDGAAPDSGSSGSGGTPASGGAAGSGGALVSGGSTGTGGVTPSPCVSNPCGPGGTCTPQGSTYTCACTAGYRASGGTCVNVDECFDATHDCHSSSACSDTNGSYACVCPSGFAGGRRGIACRPRVAAGSGHACALLANGTVKCWGASNDWGQLGDNTQSAHAEPAAVTGLTNVAAIDAGADTTCAILVDGTVKCWGANRDGQIGDNTKVNRLVPVTVPSLTDVIAIDTFWAHTCAARRDGSVRCWGNNTDGQLGASNVGGSVLTPQGVAGASGASGVAVGETQSCVILKSNGAVQCWGKGLLGDGSIASSYAPITAKNLDNVTQVVFGGFHACAIKGGLTYCWGNASVLGTGATTTDGNPTYVTSVGGVSLGIGVYSTAVVQPAGTVLYWGVGTTPAPLPGVSNVIAISHHGPNICAVHQNGSVSCWTIANSTITAPVVVSGLNVF